MRVVTRAAICTVLLSMSGPACRQAPAPVAQAGAADHREPVAEAELPPAVLAAVHAHPRASFASAAKVTRDGRVIYDLTVTGTRKTHLVVAADGTVLTFE